MKNRIARVYPRLLVGGAESGILQLLEGIDNTHMIVTHVEGITAEKAKKICHDYTLLQEPRFLSLVNHLQNASIVHIHTINNYLLIPLAANLAGPDLIVQTIHNNFEAEYCNYVDHSIVVGKNTVDYLETPTKTTLIYNGVNIPDHKKTKKCWSNQERAVRFAEIRRKDKSMSFTLEDLFKTDIFSNLSVEGYIVGIDGKSEDDRINNLGEMQLEQVYSTLEKCDFLFHASSSESFGRTAFEAMACQVIPIVTPLPSFIDTLSGRDEVVFLPSDNIDQCADAVKQVLERYNHNPELYEKHCCSAREYVIDNFSVQKMVSETSKLYTKLKETDCSLSRNFQPSDLEGSDITLFASLIDKIVDGWGETEFSSINKLQPKAQSIIYWLLCHTKSIKKEDQLPYLKYAYNNFPDRHIVNIEIGRYYLDIGKHVEAIHYFKNAIDIDKEKISPYFYLAEIYLQQKLFEESINILEKILEVSPEHSRAAKTIKEIKSLLNVNLS